MIFREFADPCKVIALCFRAMGYSSCCCTMMLQGSGKVSTNPARCLVGYLSLFVFWVFVCCCPPPPPPPTSFAVFVCVRARMHVCVCSFVCVCVVLCVCMRAHTHVCVCASECVSVCVQSLCLDASLLDSLAVLSLPACLPVSLGLFVSVSLCLCLSVCISWSKA